MPERSDIEGKTVYVVDTKYPNTKPFFNELCKILKERYPETNWVPLERESRPRFLPPDTADNLQRYFMENNDTDGGPVILPTRERVTRMLEGTSHDPGEIVGTIRPSGPHEAWKFNVEMVAVNAVMAGAKPEYFPLILALASTGSPSLFSSTSSFARLMIVSGEFHNSRLALLAG